MAAQALQQQYQDLQLTALQDNSVRSALDLAYTQAKSQISALRKKQKNVNKAIQQLALKNYNNIESNIKEAKIKQAQLAKQHLEEKLKSLEQNIKTLENSTGNKPNRPNLMLEAARKEYIEAEKQKAEEYKEFAKRLMKDRKERENKRKQERQNMLNKINEEIEFKKANEESMKAKLEEQKRLKIQQLKQKSKQRRNQIQNQISKGNEEYLKVKKAKPIYIQKLEEEQEKQKVEEIQRNELLARKKMIYQPINHSEIIEHAKRVDEYRQDNLQRLQKERSSKDLEAQLSLAQSPFSNGLKVMQREREREMEAKRKQDERLRLIEKRTQYASLVKTLFTPAIDKAKQLEIEMAKSKSVNKLPASANVSKEPQDINKKTGLSYASEKALSKWKPRKMPTNSLAPKPREKREPQFYDYLGERRRQREKLAPLPNLSIDLDSELHNTSLSPSQRLLKVQAKTNQIDRMAKRHELYLNGANSQDPQVIQHAEDINSAILSSIKAKLKLLEQNS